MKTLKLVSCSIVATAFLAVAPAKAHWDLPSCYIEVHDGCYNNDPPCSTEDYNGFLENCDTGYPSTAAIQRPKTTFVAPTRQIVMSRAYKQKMQRLQALSTSK